MSKPMDRNKAEQMLQNGIVLTADKDMHRLVVKQLEDGTYVLVSIDIDRKRSNTQTTEQSDIALAMMEAFAPWASWQVREE
jgi:hypothetical protein